MFQRKKSPKALKVDSMTQQILDLTERKKSLEIDTEQVRLKLQNSEQEAKFKIEKEKHEHSLLIKEKEYELLRTKEDLKRKHDLEMLELKALTKLEAEQKTAQAILNSKKEVMELKSKHEVELSDLKSKSAKEYYAKMQDALEDLNKNGNHQTKFVQEIALKMFDKGMEKPMPAITEAKHTHITLDTEPKNG